MNIYCNIYWILTYAFVGILGIFMQAPSMTDYEEPLNKTNAPKLVNVQRICKSDLL